MNTERLTTLLTDNFHIDVSRDQPFIVQSSGPVEIPLSTFAPSEFSRLQKRAREQYVRSVLYETDSVDQHRATLFFIYGYENQQRQERNGQESSRLSRKHQSRLARIPRTVYGKSAA